MYRALEHITKSITESISRTILSCAKIKDKVKNLWKRLWVHKSPLESIDYKEYCLIILKHAIDDIDNLQYDLANSALVGLRQYEWMAYPAELRESGNIATGHINLYDATDRIKQLRHAAKHTITELHPHRGHHDLEVLEWICPMGRGWSHDIVQNGLNAYAVQIRELCTEMHLLTTKGPINEVQKNNWWVINRELGIAINTMLQLYKKL